MNGRDYYAMFDIPHLLKSLRNNLYKYDFELDGFSISWKCITDLFKLEIIKPVALRLARKHVFLTNFAKMKVKFLVIQHILH